jgi:hypothetical protein
VIVGDKLADARRRLSARARRLARVANGSVQRLPIQADGDHAHHQRKHRHRP